MNLPNLPRKNKHKEFDLGARFREWDKKQNFPSGTYELKQTETNTFLFSAVKQKQIDFGLRVKSPQGILVRVQVANAGTADYIKLRNMPAWIVVRYPKQVCIIDVEDFNMERLSCNKPSLSSERASQIAYDIIHIK